MTVLVRKGGSAELVEKSTTRSRHACDYRGQPVSRGQAMLALLPKSGIAVAGEGRLVVRACRAEHLDKLINPARWPSAEG